MENENNTTVVTDDDAAFDAGAGFESVGREDDGAGDAGSESGSVVDGAGSDGAGDAGSVVDTVVTVAPSGSDAGDQAGKDAGAPDFMAELEKLKQQVDDNKAWGTRLAQENAELKKLVEAGVATDAQAKKTPEASDAVPPEVLEYFDSDPAAMKALSYLVEKQVAERLASVKDYGSDVTDIRGMVQQLNFEQAVTRGMVTETGFVSGHSDALQVMATQDYRDWFAVESVKNPAVLRVSSPVEAIGVLDRYKEFAAKRAADAATVNPQKDALENMMKGAVPKGTHVAKKGPDVKDMSDDEAFEAGTKR